jgi:spermidine/putrescine transport system substrate-binding protein
MFDRKILITGLLTLTALFFTAPMVFAGGTTENSGTMKEIVIPEAAVIADESGDVNPEIVEEGKLLVYSYEETVTRFFLRAYKDKYPQVKVKTAVYGELDEAIAKLRGGFAADVLNPCVDYLPLLKQLDLIRPVDTSLIPRWDDLMDYFQNLPDLDAGDGKVWMVPSDAGLEGMMYNTEKIRTAPSSWKELWNPAYKGHIAMQDYARNSIAIAALALGYEDPFHLDDEQLAEIQDFLIEQKPLLLKYFEGDEEVDSLFSEGEVWISLGWSSDARSLSDDGVPVEFISPEEGALSWICGYSITRGTNYPIAAHAMVNHYIRPELQEFEAVDFEYFVPNGRVLDTLSDEEIELVGLDKPEALEKSHVEIIPDNYDKWLQVWETVKSTQ